MPSPPAILSEIAHLAVREAFKGQPLTFREGSARDLATGRAAVAAIQGPDARGTIQLVVEEGVLESIQTAQQRGQDQVNELSNILVGQFEAELLRRGLAVHYQPPRAVAQNSLQSFDCGKDGVVCYFDASPGRVAVAVQLDLEPGAKLEAFPTRRLPVRNVRLASAPPSGSSSVLVVDDSATARDGLTGALSSAGLHVLQAESGIAALNLLRDRPDIGMVFTDLHMPGISGGEFIQKVKADEKLSALPIVVITASAAGIQKIQRSDIVTALLKPISPAAVISLARRVLNAA